MVFQSEKADIETSSEDYARRFSGEIGKYFLSVQAEKTLYLLKPWNGGKILDVGGGHAQLAVPLVKNAFHLTVAASSESCEERLIMFLDPGTYKFVSCNLLDLPFDDKSFDAVPCFRLLTHEANWKLQIAELCRVAKHAVIIDYPDLRSFNFFYKFLFNTKKSFEGNTRNYRSFSRKELLQAFKENKFNSPVFKPEFFLPMVVHRALKNLAVLKNMERFFNLFGITKLFGSPVILRVTSADESLNKSV